MALRKNNTVQAARSIGLLWMGTIIGSLLAFVGQIILARHLEPHGYGALLAALAVVNLAASVASFGQPAFWLRTFGMEGWNGLRWVRPSLIVVAAWVSTCSLLLVLWSSSNWTGKAEGALVLILIPVVASLAMIELAKARFQLEERYRRLALWQLLPHLARAAIALLAMVAGASVTSVAAGYSLAIGLLGALSLVVVVGLFGQRFQLRGHGPWFRARNQAPNVSEVVVSSWPFGLLGVFYLIFYQSDIILLRQIAGARSAGVYGVAVSVVTAVYLLPAVVQKYLIPKLHRWAATDRSRLADAYRMGNLFLLGIGTAFMLAIILLATTAVPALFGDSYQASVSVLMLLALGVPIRFLSSNVGAFLLTDDHVRRKALYMGAAALSNVVLNLFLIPLYRHHGAAVATLISEALLLGFYLYAAERRVFRFSPSVGEPVA